MKKIKGAIIGLGYWGPNLVRNFIKIPTVEIAKACDISKTARNRFAKDFPYINTSDDFDKILADKSIQFIAIATPLKTHFSLAKKSLLAKKHILIEKPMTSTSDEAKQLIEIAEKSKRIIMVGHTFIYSEAIKEIKKSNFKKKILGNCSILIVHA